MHRMIMKTAFYLMFSFGLLFYLSTMTSCTNKSVSTVYDTVNTQQNDPYKGFKPTTMVWNDTGNSTYWSRCWIHHYSYNSTGQLTNIYVRAFDADSVTSKPDSLLYTLTYDNIYSTYPTEYTFKYYGASGGLLTNDVHKLISDQQVVYLDTAKVGILYAGGDTLIKYQYSYANGKTTIIRSDFKDSCEYLITGDKLQQVNEYALPSYSLGYQYFYTYQTGIVQYVNPLWYVKVNKYLSGNGFDGISKYLPTTFNGIYSAPNYNFSTSLSYVTDSMGRVIVAKSNNVRERTTTVYSY